MDDLIPKWHFGSIIHKILCISIFTPYDICQLAHQICFKLQRCFMSFGHSSKVMCNSQFAINKNNYRAMSHQHVILPFMASYYLTKPYNDGVTSCKHPASPRSQIAMYTTFSLSSGKCNIMLSLDKQLCKIIEWCTTFTMFYERPC